MIHNRTRFLLLIVFALLIFVLVIAMNFGTQIQEALCGSNNIVADNLRWGIVESTGDSRITWQKGAIILYRDRFSNSNRNSVTFADETVVQKQEIIDTKPFPCNASHIDLIAYDLATGQEKWRLNPLNSALNTYPLEKSFLLIDNSAAVNIQSSDGKEIWHIPDTLLPLRTIRQVYSIDNYIYVVSATGLHQIDKQNGTVLKTIESHDLLAYFGDYAIKASNGNQLQIMHLENGNLEKPSPNLSISIEIDEQITDNWPVIQRADNYLILSFEGKKIEIYRLSTGELLWRLDYPITIPALLGNSIVVCNKNRINIYDLESGQETAFIRLSKGEDDSSDALSQISTCAAADPNTVVMKFRDTGELVAVQTDLTESN